MICAAAVGRIGFADKMGLKGQIVCRSQLIQFLYRQMALGVIDLMKVMYSGGLITALAPGLVAQLFGVAGRREIAHGGGAQAGLEIHDRYRWPS